MWPAVIKTDFEREFQRVSRILRKDDCIDETASGGISCIQLLFVILAHALHLGFEIVVGCFSGLRQLVQLSSEYRLDCGVAFHDTHSSGRPTEDEIRIEALPSHRVVAGAGGMIDCQNYLWHHCRRHRFHKARARTNDPGMLGFRSNHKSGDVLKKQKRRLMAVAGLYKVGDLFRRFSVDDSAESRGAAAGWANHPSTVGDQPYLNPADSGVA